MSMIALAAAAAAFSAAPCNFEGVPADFERQNGIECGWVAVPRDERSGKSIRLWTAIVRATGPDKKADPILYINGGPGIATVDSVGPGVTGTTMKMLRADRDIILFDQRGSGRSEEALCPQLGKQLDAIADAGLSSVAEEDRSRDAIAACRAQAEKAGFDLSAYSTDATVADIEALRKAFNVGKWNLMSVSYGSLVALHAMRTHPASIRSAILNSPYPPNSVTWAEQASSAAGAYEAIDRACAAEAECRTRFGALVPKLEEVIARLEKAALKDGARSVTGRRFATALWPLAVRSATVRFVPLAIDRAHKGDEAFIKRMAATFAGPGAFGGFSPAQAYAISCPESGRTRDWYARAQRLHPGLVSTAPADSWDRMCAAYKPGFVDPTFFAPVASPIPTLVYAGTLDPATPLVDAYQAIRFLPHATLVEVVNAAHAPAGVDDCTRGIAKVFLADPRTEPDKSCVAARVPPAFATDGIDELLAPAY